MIFQDRQKIKSALSRLTYISEQSELNPVEWGQLLRTVQVFFEKCKSPEEMQHEFGSPLLAIEINCEFLKKRMAKHGVGDHEKVFLDIQDSIEKIKLVINEVYDE